MQKLVFPRSWTTPNVVEYINQDHHQDNPHLDPHMEFSGEGDLGQVIKKLKTNFEISPLFAIMMLTTLGVAGI